MKSKTAALTSLLFIAFAPASYADDHKGHDHMMHDHMMKEPTPEMRKKMAEAHQKMADCLKSDKKFSECHQVMKDMHHEMGMKHDHDNDNDKSAKSEKKE